MIHKVSIFILATLVLACGPQKNTYEQEQEQTIEIKSPEALAEMGEANNSGISGTAKFGQEDGHVVFTLQVSPIAPGMHAVHIHEKGDCSASDATSAGGHWNPTNAAHGQRGVTTEYHAGDIDNMEVGPDSIGYLERKIEGWAIGGGNSQDLVGKAVIIHSGADDFTSQPSGAAGPRVACGVIQQTQ